jgi:MFS family permease
VVGAFASFFAAWLIPRIAAQYIMALGTSAILGSTIIVATMPAKQLYWAQLFPAAVLMALCPDFVFTAAQIITSNSVQKHEQGVAGSLIGTLLTYGMSMGLGFAGTVEMRVNNNGKDIVEGYRGALYVAIGLAGAALAIDLLCVRMPKDEREGWDEDVPQRSGSRIERVASRLGVRSRSSRSNRAGSSAA